MRFLFAVIGILSFALAGCFVEEPQPSAADYVRLESNQTHHFRPIHQLYSEWSAQKIGKKLTIRSDGSPIKLSTRYDPNQVLIRKSGNVIGSVASENNIIRVIPTDQTSSGQEQIALRCVNSETAVLTGNGFSQIYTFGDHKAASPKLSISELSDPRSIAICSTNGQNTASDQCQDIKIDSPFNAMGTLIFHEDRIALEFRSALAWYVTVFEFCKSK